MSVCGQLRESATSRRVRGEVAGAPCHGGASASALTGAQTDKETVGVLGHMMGIMKTTAAVRAAVMESGSCETRLKVRRVGPQKHECAYGATLSSSRVMQRDVSVHAAGRRLLSVQRALGNESPWPQGGTKVLAASERLPEVGHTRCILRGAVAELGEMSTDARPLWVAGSVIYMAGQHRVAREDGEVVLGCGMGRSGRGYIKVMCPQAARRMRRGLPANGEGGDPSHFRARGCRSRR